MPYIPEIKVLRKSRLEQELLTHIKSLNRLEFAFMAVLAGSDFDEEGVFGKGPRGALSRILELRFNITHEQAKQQQKFLKSERAKADRRKVAEAKAKAKGQKVAEAKGLKKPAGMSKRDRVYAVTK